MFTKGDRMKVIDLFCGAGGLSLGFKNAGFTVVAAIDNWDPALRTYQSNFDHPVIKSDLTDVNTITGKLKAFKPEIIIGGPPCQDFSSAGLRNESARANLTVAFAKIIGNLKPSYFVFENVPLAKYSHSFKEAQRIWKEAGYGLTSIVLDASLCGVPQRRKRLFCVGARYASDGFLERRLQTGYKEHPTTVREYCGSSIKVNNYYRHPRSYKRRAVFSIDEPAPTIRGTNRPVAPGYKGHPRDTAPVSEVRPLTSDERALIQTFPTTYIWDVDKRSDKEQLIGNAVPVKLGEFVANALREWIQNKE